MHMRSWFVLRQNFSLSIILSEGLQIFRQLYLKIPGSEPRTFCLLGLPLSNLPDYNGMIMQLHELMHRLFSVPSLGSVALQVG